jgi:hypothetical protein
MLVRAAAPGRRQAGFTLLEAMISLLLVMIALTLAVSLLDDARRMLDAGRRDATDPMPRYARVTLRRDLSEARAASSSLLPELWTSEPLALATAEPGHLRYDVEGDRLVRTRYDLEGAPVSRRVVLAGLDGWRWRNAGGGLLDIELRYRRSPLSLLGANPRDAARRAAPRPVVDRFRVALRGARSRSRW